MSIDQLEFMLCDMYEVDLYVPESTFFKTDFKKASYTVWAIDELDLYIYKRLAPDTVGTVDEFIGIISDFIKMSSGFSKKNSYTKQMFSMATELAENVREVLYAMK